MRGDRKFTSRSCFFFTRRFKKCWQLFDSLLTHNWTDNGGSERFVWSVGLFPIVQTSIDGRGYSSTNKAAWKSFDVEVWWACLCFIVSCVFPFEWPTRMSDKESTTKRTAQGNEMVGLDGSSSWQQCRTGTTLSDTTRRTWDQHRNLEYSTESEPEERRQEKTWL